MAFSGEPKYLVMTNAPHIEITESDYTGGKIPLHFARQGSRVLPKADEKHTRYWKDTVATYVMHDGKFWSGLRPGSVFTMDEFPAGYQLHVSTRKDSSQDFYLFSFKPDGSRGKRVFRSPLEFALHAKWLAFGRPKGACECSYCSGTRQKLLEARLKEATKHVNMPRRPGLNLMRSGRRKKDSGNGGNDGNDGRANKRARLSTTTPTIRVKDYTKGPSYVSELHKQQQQQQQQEEQTSEETA